MNPIRFSAVRSARNCLAALFSLCISAAPTGAATSISDNPLILNVTAAPNVMFLLDNSGSMLWESLPDYFSDLWDFEKSILTGSATSTYVPDYSDTNIFNLAMRTAEINRVYYNPSVTYRRWTNADGTQYANSSPTAAKISPESSVTVDLTVQQSGTFRWYKNTSSTFVANKTTLPRSNACSTTSCSKTFCHFRGPLIERLHQWGPHKLRHDPP